MRKSKFIGKEFDGWRVADRVILRYKKTQGTRNRFVVSKIIEDKAYATCVWDYQLTQVANNKKTMSEIIDKKSQDEFSVVNIYEE